MEIFKNIKKHFYQSMVVVIDDKPLVVYPFYSNIDKPSNIHYYVYRDILNNNNYLRTEPLKGHNIKEYLYRSELDDFLRMGINEKRMLGIIARAIDYEKDIIRFNKEEEKKKILKP